MICPLYISEAQTGSVHEPVRYIGGTSIDPHVHEGRLRYAVGVESRQTMRANRTHSTLGLGPGWTYSHASNLAYWKGHFLQQYLSNPVDEHIPPGHTLLVSSQDGRDWSKPRIIFPHYEAPDSVDIPEGSIGYMMHQRMGFYVTDNDRLLVLAFYGHAEDPFTTGGIGRVVRELYPDLSLGPIYFIRYDSHTEWGPSNTSFPFYKSSPDRGFVQACDELLNDKLMTLQWRDEDHGLDGYYQVTEAGEALSYYQRRDGATVALWKRAKSALSFDGGLTFSRPVKCPTLIMAGGKVWGQHTEDDRYALCYNPIDMDEHRYPLIICTGDDGIIYDHMLVVQGEVPPRRFFGRWKDYGPCYVRGIVPGNGNPPGEDMWITYSMNKEDIWVSRIPLPIKYKVSEEVDDHFESPDPSGAIPDWNIYAPCWAPVDQIQTDSEQGVLRLQDKDPADYARAIRIIPERQRHRISMRVMPLQDNHGHLEIDIVDRYGNRPVRIWFDDQGSIHASVGHQAKALMAYQPDKWYHLDIAIDAQPYGSFDLSINGKVALSQVALTESVKSVERISIRTGTYRDLPNRRTINEEPTPPFPGGDEPVPNAVYYVDDVVTKTWP